MMDTNVDGKVQRTQVMLYAKASTEPDLRFKRLYKYLARIEWVEMAIDKTLRNRGSRTAGIDGKTRSDYMEEDERAELANLIKEELRTQSYQPEPVRQIYIPKANGKKRPLGIATIKDRVIQQMVKMVIEPIFEATFLPCSYGFRSNRHPGQSAIHRDNEWFTSRGFIVSPVLANVYLHRLDEWFHHRFHAMTTQERHQGRQKGELVSVRYIRYCDDFIVMLRDEDKAEALKSELALYLDQELKMTLSDEKTTIVQAQEGFDFLGVRTFITFQKSNPTKILPYQIPAQKSVKAYRQKRSEPGV